MRIEGQLMICVKTKGLKKEKKNAKEEGEGEGERDVLARQKRKGNLLISILGRAEQKNIIDHMHSTY